MSDPVGPAGRDPGLQPERTRLAWRRSVLAHAMVTLLLVRLALTHGTAGAIAAAVALGGWALVVMVSYRRMTGPRGAGQAVNAGRDGYAGQAVNAGRAVNAAPPTARPGGPALPVSGAIAVGYAALGAVLLLIG